MCSEQGGSGNNGVTELTRAELYDKAEEKIKNKIKITRSVTFLKKVYASGLYEEEVFKRLSELAFPKEDDDSDGSSEALLQILLISKEAKENSGTGTKSRKNFAQSKVL